MVFGFCKNKCKHEVYTKEEVDNLIANVVSTLNQHISNTYTKEQVDNLMGDVASTLNLGTIATHDYSIGTATPSGGSNGDIYDQYFE